MWLYRRGHRVLAFVAGVSIVVAAGWAAGLALLAVGEHFSADGAATMAATTGLAAELVGTLVLVAAKLGTWALVLAAPFWIAAAVIQHRRRWDTTALDEPTA